jgi:hypothetical protein
MNRRTQLVCAWLGPIGTLVLFFAMLFLMHILPPFRPALPLGDLVAIYHDRPTSMITGGLLLMLATSIYMPFFALVAVQMRRMEKAPLWTYVFLTSSVLAFYSVIVAEMVFSGAAYRPERSAMLIQTLSDLAFILYVGTALPGSVQMVSVGFAVLSDDRADPVYPRWVGYLDIWAGILASPGTAIALFKVGPFAWNGVLAFWVAAVAFGIWLNVNFWAARRAILRSSLARGGV